VDGSRRRIPPPRVPAPLARLGHTLGLPVTEVTRYWAQERSSIRAGAGALAIGLVATLIAGTVLGVARERIVELPGLLVLIPAAIGMRGSIFGALAARLGTGIHTGEFGPALERRTFLGRQLEASAILTVSTSVEAGVVAWGVSRLIGLPSIPLLELVAVALVGGLLSSMFLVGVTIWLARRAFDRGWNMDDVGAPTITATGDLITLPALLVATLLLAWEPLAIALGALGIVAAVVAAVIGWRKREPTIRRVVRESLLVLTVAVTVDVLAGTVMESRTEQLITVPTLLVLIPPFVATCGSLGGMLASRFSSKLHIGLLQPRAWPSQAARLDISLTFLLAFLAFAGVGAVGWVAAQLAGLDPPGLLALVWLALVGGVFAAGLIAVVAYTAATASFRFGLDPDNHGIPIVTAAMDLLGILCLVGATALTRLG